MRGANMGDVALIIRDPKDRPDHDACTLEECEKVHPS
jgi:hypothetical protein